MDLPNLGRTHERHLCRARLLGTAATHQHRAPLAAPHLERNARDAIPRTSRESRDAPVGSPPVQGERSARFRPCAPSELPSDCASDCDPLGFVHVRHRSSPLIASSESLIAPLITPMSAGTAGQPVACRRGTSHTHRRLPRCRRARWRCARHGAQRVDQGRVHPLTTARSRRAAAEERRESADWDPIWQPRSASADWDPIWAARRCLASLYETHLRHPRFVNCL